VYVCILKAIEVKSTIKKSVKMQAGKNVMGGLGPLSPQKLAQEVRLSLTLIN
jgi:hypothetical protein